MTHEVQLLLETIKSWQQLGKRAVLASVVALEGQSYRRPGVRMIISEDGEQVGAVSGGCVEQEIVRQAQSVFMTGISKIMTYDGRLRIGCDGILSILIEPVFLENALLNEFELVLASRQKFGISSFYFPVPCVNKNMGSLIILNNRTFSLYSSFSASVITDQKSFKQTFEPLFRLFIFGAEHDAVRLCQAAKQLGWEVTIVASADESKSCDYFPGATSLIAPSFGDIDISLMDNQTAVVLMTHSFTKDVQYLMALTDCRPAYLGMVGSLQRRERVISTLLEYRPDISIEFLEQIHSPAGLNLGAENASEIAVSILAEILSEVNHKVPEPLRNKVGSIHG